MLKNSSNIVVFSITYYPFVGGAEVALKEITKRLTDYEFSIITLWIDKALPRIEKQGNVTIYRIGFPSKKKLVGALNWKLLISKYTFPFFAYFTACKLHKKRPFFLSWSIMANYAGFAALFFKRANPTIPFLLTLQEGDSPAHIKRKVGFFMPLYRSIFLSATRVQAISTFLADYAFSIGRRGKTVVIPNGVDINNFSQEFEEDLGKKPGDIFLVTSSRLVRKNGIDILIGALAYLPKNYKLLIIGEGEERGELQKLTAKLDLAERVRFLGFIAHDKLPRYLKACDIFCRPSRSEGFGNSFIEAMAAKLPVIATPIGGIPDFLEDQKTGLFCAVDDPESIAKATKRLIEDHKLRETIIENAWHMVEKKYDWDIISARFREELFNTL